MHLPLSLLTDKNILHRDREKKSVEMWSLQKPKYDYSAFSDIYVLYTTKIHKGDQNFLSSF